MSDTTPEQIQGQLAEMLAKLQASGAQPQAAASGWAKPITAVSIMPNSVSIPLNLITPGGKLRTYLNFDGAAGQSQESLMALVESLHNAGMPLDFWKGSDSWGKGGGGGWRR
jgi:hypothetical protein